MKLIDEAKKKDLPLLAKLDGADAAIEYIAAETEKYRAAYRAGEMSVKKAADEAFSPTSIHSFMCARRLSFSVAKDYACDFVPHDRYLALERAHEQWKNGQEITTDEVWLFKHPDFRFADTFGFEFRLGEGEPASPEDMDAFFRACHAACVPVLFFDTPPSDIPTPGYWNTSETNGEFFLDRGVDVTPLLIDDDPVGKAFDLPIAGGGVLHLFEITSVEPEFHHFEDEEYLESLEWNAIGCAEGYLSPKPHAIRFTSYDDQASFICAVPDEGDADWEAFSAYELWEPYRAWCGAHHQAVSEATIALFLGEEG
ncbi:MAG: hypothetical protein IJH83_02695 [Coriobacteriales bacterium]|nr:hypothetical protein [Coriobacteriales bacterium]